MISYMMIIRNRYLLADAFTKYLECATSSPEADCIETFRTYALPQLMLTADFAWQADAIITPTIFLFAYKEVRNLWFSIITCGLYSRRTRASRITTVPVKQNGARNTVVPLIIVSHIETSESASSHELL
jgi:hypothetical protein